MTILPVLKRELVAVVRRGGEFGSRSFFAATLLINVLGTFATWYYWEGERVSHRLMSLIAEKAFLIALALHWIVLIKLIGQTARSVAFEKDRGTLDFLLATRLSSAEIILGKLAAHLLVFLMSLAVGLPIMLLLNRLGGVDGWLIILGYAAIISTGFFLGALAIWFSATAPDSRRALARAVLWYLAWFSLPFFVAYLLPRLGVQLPVWLRSANGWLLASSPASLLLKLPNLAGWKGFIDSFIWMCVLQMAGVAICLIGAIVQLRSVYRAATSVETRDPLRKLMHTSWRLRPRPPVGDDPIFWRERYTNRAGFGETFRSACLSGNRSGDCLPDVVLRQACNG